MVEVVSSLLLLLLLLRLTLPSASSEPISPLTTSGDVEVILALTFFICMIVDPPAVLMTFIGSGAVGMEETAGEVVGGGASIGANVAPIAGEGGGGEGGKV